MDDQPTPRQWAYVTDPLMLEMCRIMEGQPEWFKRKILRYMIRFVNKDPKLQRLIELRDKGYISIHEFLRLM